MQTLRFSIFLACLLLGPAAGAVHAAPPVLLANVYEHADVDLSDYWVSEKYDGIRAWWDGEKLLTRAGNVIHAPPWFTQGWPLTPLDGELWIGRGQFEAVSATVRDATPDDAAWRKVKFMVFDSPTHAGVFDDRLTALTALLSEAAIASLQPVKQFKVIDQPALEAKLAEIIAGGGEGLMLHRGASHYRGERNDDLLKLKPYDDAEARVIGHTPGKGKYSGMLGALLVERADGLRFKLGTGFSDEQRRHPPPIGAWVTFTHHGVTAKGVPRFARFLRVREEVGSL
ncbi:MAG: DNA ligase [Steroidobacter sp.]